jgi:hypothetical protein
MRPGSTPLTVMAAIAGTAGLLFLFPPLAVAALVFTIIVAIQASRHDRPITAELNTWSARWHLWLTASASFLLIGLDALVADGDRDLTTAAWTVRVLSWLSGATVGVIGLGLGATRDIRQRRA